MTINPTPNAMEAEQARKIAAGLTEAQRHVLTKAKALNDGTFCQPLSATTQSCRATEKRGLTDGFRLTPLGLAVRNILQETEQ